MTRPRVLLADDHRLLREAFARLIEPECDVVGEAADGRQLLAVAPVVRPDVVVVDVSMPLLNGIDAARQLRQLMPQVKVVILTASEEPGVAADALRAGASGYLVKNSAADELLRAIHEVFHGRTYITPLSAQGVIASLLDSPQPADRPAGLSPRQREILQLLAEGHTMKEIGHLLKITPRTVAFHKYAMMKQLGVKSSAGLMRFAVELHLVPG